MMHFEAKMPQFRDETGRFEAKVKHSDPKTLKTVGFGPGAIHFGTMVPLGFKYTFDILI